MNQKPLSRVVFSAPLVSVLLWLHAPAAVAEPRFGTDTVNIKLGAFISDFDTKAGVTGPSGGEANIDFEEVLGLTADQESFRGDLAWRFAPRHRVMLGYYAFNRSAQGASQRQIEIDDPDNGLIVIDAGATVQSKFDWQLVPVSYAYSFYKTNDIEVSGSLGVHWVDLTLGLSGNATVNGVANTFVNESESISGPLPVFGLRADYAITPSWLVGTHAQYFSLDYDDYAGELLDLRLHTEYWFTDSFGASLGYTFYDIDIARNLGGGYRVSADYDYRGLEAYLTFRF